MLRTVNKHRFVSKEGMLTRLGKRCGNIFKEIFEGARTVLETWLTTSRAGKKIPIDENQRLNSLSTFPFGGRKLWDQNTSAIRDG